MKTTALCRNNSEVVMNAIPKSKTPGLSWECPRLNILYLLSLYTQWEKEASDQTWTTVIASGISSICFHVHSYYLTPLFLEIDNNKNSCCRPFWKGKAKCKNIKNRPSQNEQTRPKFPYSVTSLGIYFMNINKKVI